MKAKKRFLSILLSLTLVLGALPGVSLTALAAPNDDHFDLSKTTLGTGVIKEPLSGEGRENSEWVGDYVIWGNYVYRVLDPDTTDFSAVDEDGQKKHTMLLDTGTAWSASDFIGFDSDKKPNEGAYKANDWTYSDLKAYLNGERFLYNSNHFSEAERSAVTYSTKPAPVEGDGNGYWRWRYAPLKNDRIFVLDGVEVTRPGYGYSNLTKEFNESKSTEKTNAFNRIKQNGTYQPLSWWTRSPYNSDKSAYSSVVGHVCGYANNKADGGNFASAQSNATQAKLAPAFNIDLDRVLWCTFVYSRGTVHNYTMKTYAPTLKSDCLRTTITEGQQITCEGNKYTIPFTVTDTGATYPPSCLTVMVVRETGEGKEIKQYGKLDLGDAQLTFKDNGSGIKTAVGTGTFTLSDEYTPSTDTVYLMAEYISYCSYDSTNHDNYTGKSNYASPPLEILQPGTVHGLTYTGSATKLVTNSTLLLGYTAKYALTDISTTSEPSDESAWSETIPSGTGVGTYRVWYRLTKNESTINGHVDVKIDRANEDVDTPANLTATYGQTLADVTLPSGYAWEDSATTSVGSAGTRFFWARYTPADKKNYHEEEKWLSIMVNKADPIEPKGLTATYGQTLEDVTLPEGWTWVDAVTTSVGDVGSHTFKANFTSADANYNDKSNVDVTVTVSGGANNPATVASTASVIRGGNTVDLANNVTKNGAMGNVGYAINGEAKGCTLDGSVLTSGNETGTVTVNVTVAADDNYNALATTPITVTISDKGTQTITAENVTAAYGDTDKSVNATTDGNGAISYAVKDGSGDYIDVDVSSGALTIKKVGTATVVVTAAETSTYTQAAKEVTVTINKASAVAATVTANNRTYDGTEKPLVTVSGTPTGGEMRYALGTATEATEQYTTSIPTKTEAGTYFVWYKVAGDENHNDTDSEVLSVRILPVNRDSLISTVSEARAYYNEIKDNEDYKAIAESLKSAIEQAQNAVDNNKFIGSDLEAALKAIADAFDAAKTGVKEIDDAKAAKEGETKPSEKPDEKHGPYKTGEDRIEKSNAARDELVSLINEKGSRDVISGIYQSPYDTVSTNYAINGGRISQVYIDVNSLKDGDNYLTMNTGTRLVLSEKFTVADNFGSEKEFKKAGKLIKYKKGSGYVLELKKFKGKSAYELVLMNEGGNRKLIIDVIDLSLNRKSLKTVMLSETVLPDFVSKNAVSENRIDENGFAKNEGVVTIASVPVLRTGISGQENRSARFISGIWMVGDTAISGGETKTVTKGKAKVYARVNSDGSLSIGKADGSGKGSVPVSYILNGKVTVKQGKAKMKQKIYKAKIKVK